MNRTQALKEARRRWGPKAIIEDHPKQATTPESRQAAREARMELRGFILTREDRRFFHDFMDELLFQSLRQRFMVGVHEGFFISVRGHGDTWSECFENADRMWGKKAA